ncbi:Guanine nucleotide-binding protein subunit alpha [Choanephora cucurbitarum]|uniref:Guanine nucleotide-binding protein alpha-16 subunit n=1 Tax=Choanephora cucurbitarum TaxID=101091 RepID=A0A1C7NQP5_9FUNG|nr:Guanine nucleotide-binding protein subunit alpha [Choanephora cucurbitarum]
MGCSFSKKTPDQTRNKEIDQQIRQDKSEMRKEIKLLMLGAGESGKSTVLKQMKLIHEGDYSLEEKELYKKVVYCNIVQSMRVILSAMQEMDIQLEDEEAEKCRESIDTLPMQVQSLSEEQFDALKILWQDHNLKSVLRRNREYQLNDSAKYFFDSLDRISQPDYLPTNQDILRARAKTTGIAEYKFRMGDLLYCMVDVGGQRSERKKWIHCFENVVAIIFMVALSEFDQVLIEDEQVNRMHESFILFDSICNSKWFEATSLILFLNKTDLFREKIEEQHVELSETFPDYQGGSTYKEGCQYIMRRFLSLNKQPSKQVYTHFTCATDTQQIGFVMSATNDVILRDNLNNQGLI